MSVWTHVAAVARIDSLFPPEDGEEFDFEKLFGKACKYGSPDEVWSDARRNPGLYLPMGSEGSLTMSVWTCPEKYHAARYTVTIFGDLRDYDDARGIVQWFRDRLKSFPLIRQAMITAETEFMETVSWTYRDGQEDEPVITEWKDEEE